MIWYPPSKTFRYALKRGMIGHEVAALQIMLNDLVETKYSPLVEDGVYGAVTEAAVKLYQIASGLKDVDGIAGTLTQRTIALQACARVEANVRLPKGLLKGLMEGESGFILGCVSWSRNSYGYGVDAGTIQDRVWTEVDGNAVTPTLARWRESFGLLSIQKAAEKIRAKYLEYRKITSSDQYAWECAILYHNWPAAAKHRADGTLNVWRYESINSGGGLSWYGIDDPAFWIIEIGVNGVSTGRQWIKHYIDSKALYITNWSA